MIRDRIRSLRRVKAGDLIGDPRNWRRHPPAQARALRSMLEDVGMADAILVRETPEGLMIVDGHLRADLLPDDQVPVLVLDVDEDEAGRLLATLDPLASMAETDREALDALLATVTIEDADLLELLKPSPKVGNADPDAVPADAEPRTKSGDLWLLGEHRLLCGDATNAEDVARLLDGAVPGIMVTDPPYGVNYDPQWREEAAAKGLLHFAPTRTGKVMNDDRVSWREAWALFPGPVLYVWHGALHAAEVAGDLEAVGFDIRAQIIWVKPYAPISRGAYHWRHEPCWYGVRKGSSAGWAGDRKQTTVIEAVSPNNPSGSGELAEAETFTPHGAQKPVLVMAMPVFNHRGDVYDPFVGSGTSIIGAEMLNRRCLAIDVDPHYVDVAVKRWEDFAGEKAVRG